MRVTIQIERELRDRLSTARISVNKTWDDYLEFLLQFYIKHADKDDSVTDTHEYERFYLGDQLPDSLSHHQRELFSILSELENDFKNNPDIKIKAMLAEKIAKINATAKQISEGVQEDRIAEEIAQIKANRLKIFKNIAPTNRILVKDPIGEIHAKKEGTETEVSNEQG